MISDLDKVYSIKTILATEKQKDTIRDLCDLLCDMDCDKFKYVNENYINNLSKVDASSLISDMLDEVDVLDYYDNVDLYDGSPYDCGDL